jgi:CHAT domain-containing protein
VPGSVELYLGATAAAERILTQATADPVAGDRALEQLRPTTSGDPELSLPPAVIASYCSAAGEAMRIARSGSSNRARSYLLAALAAAANLEDGPLQARIAYRLALTSRDFPVRPDLRSASRAMAETVSSIEMPGGFASGPNDNCRSLIEVPLDDQSNWAASNLALECAADRAAAAGAPRLEALALLQNARITLAEAQRRAQDSAMLRADAGGLALNGLGPARRIADLSIRFDFTARLIETALDAEMLPGSEIADGLAALSRDRSDDPGRTAWLHALQGRALLARGSSEAAAAQLRQAIFFESQRSQPVRLADWYLLLAAADPAKRATYALQAYHALETVRPFLPARDPLTEESIFSLRVQPVFNAAVDLRLSDPQGDVLLAQEVVEKLRQAEIQSVFGADCVPPRIPVGPEELSDGEILFYPILLEDRVEILFAVKLEGQAAPQYQRITVRDGARLERVERLVKTMTLELAYFGIDGDWEESASALFELLIAPIEQYLGEHSTLIIVPDGILRRVPFAALLDPEGAPLVARTAITVAPSLAYTRPGDRAGKNVQVVAASLSAEVDLPAGRFPALAATAEEARMAAGFGDPLAKRGVVLEDFERAELVDTFAAQSIDVLHLATHASFNGRSDRSFIVAQDGAILLSELRELIERSGDRGELLALIVLSACETALGDDQATMGLAGAAVQAGSESALASLWEVSDEGTAQLMRNFYLNYAAGQGRATALRNAQLALIEEDDGLWSDPRIWAAFTLLGAWR